MEAVISQDLICLLPLLIFAPVRVLICRCKATQISGDQFETAEPEVPKRRSAVFPIGEAAEVVSGFRLQHPGMQGSNRFWAAFETTPRMPVELPGRARACCRDPHDVYCHHLKAPASRHSAKPLSKFGAKDHFLSNNSKTFGCKARICMATTLFRGYC